MHGLPRVQHLSESHQSSSVAVICRSGKSLVSWKRAEWISVELKSHPETREVAKHWVKIRERKEVA